MDNEKMPTEKVVRLTDEDIEKIPYHVVQSNSLISANYNLEVVEHKIINAAIAQIRKYDEKVPMLFITYRQIAHLCNLDEKHLHRQMSRIAENLLDKQFIIYGREKKGIAANEDEEEVVIRGHWISLIKLFGDGMSIQLSPDLAPYILSIKRDFTDRKLEDIQKYKKEEAMRFDLLFTSIFNKKTSRMSVPQKQDYSFSVCYTINELRLMFGCWGKYERTNDFVRIIIEPSIAEINEKDFFNVSYTKKKIGKSIFSVEFNVSLGSNSEWFDAETVQKLKAQEKKRHTIEALFREKFDFSDEDIEAIKKLSSSRLMNMLSDIKHNKVENPKEYILEAAGKKKPKSDVDALWDSIG